MRRSSKFAAAAAAVALVGSSLGASAVASGRDHQDAAASHRAGHPRLDRVFVIMLENHSRSSVIGNANAPFMNKMADRYQMADNYYGFTHPSMPNYIAAIAGDNFGIQDDEDENVVNLDERNLVDQLEEKHISWGAYMDSMPEDKEVSYWPGSSTKLYAKKHNPFVLFDDIKNSPERMAKVKEYGALAGDLDSVQAPRFVWISPNQCNDMHGGVYSAVDGHPETPCPYGSAKDDANDAALKQKADAFVKTTVHTIMGSQAWTKHSAIVIVTDENDYTGNEETGGWENADGCCASPYVAKGDERISPDWPGGTYGGGQIPAIVISPQGQHGYVDHTAYNHYSLLRTIEQNWHLGTLRHAGDTQLGVQSMWKTFLG
jgi:phospholipase C